MGWEMKARIWAKRREHTLEGGSKGHIGWTQQRQVRFADIGRVDHFVWQEGSTERRDEKLYWGDSETSPFPFWEFRLGSTGLGDPEKGDEQKRDRVIIVL